jgi:hypothetical protein
MKIKSTIRLMHPITVSDVADGHNRATYDIECHDDEIDWDVPGVTVRLPSPDIPGLDGAVARSTFVPFTNIVAIERSVCSCPRCVTVPS